MINLVSDEKNYICFFNFQLLNLIFILWKLRNSIRLKYLRKKTKAVSMSYDVCENIFHFFPLLFDNDVFAVLFPVGEYFSIH